MEKQRLEKVRAEIVYLLGCPLLIDARGVVCPSDRAAAAALIAPFPA